MFVLGIVWHEFLIDFVFSIEFANFSYSMEDKYYQLRAVLCTYFCFYHSFFPSVLIFFFFVLHIFRNWHPDVILFFFLSVFFRFPLPYIHFFDHSDLYGCLRWKSGIIYYRQVSTHRQKQRQTHLFDRIYFWSCVRGIYIRTLLFQNIEK